MNDDGFQTFVILLTVLFIGLKLTGHISWAWYAVLIPLWLPTFGLFVFISFILIIKWMLE